MLLYLDRVNGTIAPRCQKQSKRGTLTATIAGGAEKDTITFPVTITSDNYADSTVNVVFTLIECPHKHTELCNKVDSTCTVKGYSGDTYCFDCERKKRRI